MGHDIFAYETKQISYLRRNAFDELNDKIYLALDALDYYAGVSGDGGLNFFYKDQLEEALTRLK